MADDIVDLDMLRCSLCCKYPNKRKCFSCSVADEIERLRAERDAIDKLHHPVSSGKDDEVCNNCACFWPCTTHSLLHPKEARNAG